MSKNSLERSSVGSALSRGPALPVAGRTLILVPPEPVVCATASHTRPVDSTRILPPARKYAWRDRRRSCCWLYACHGRPCMSAVRLVAVSSARPGFGLRRGRLRTHLGFDGMPLVREGDEVRKAIESPRH